ncbi:MAG TPA: hypothetical protein VM434_08665 [Beijerinckiaceae bacterium]|nr:hypothetical protein [Beijerinckiaceae bacterium]
MRSWSLTGILVVLALAAGAAVGLLVDLDPVRQTGSVEPAPEVAAVAPSPAPAAPEVAGAPRSDAASGPAEDPPEPGAAAVASDEQAENEKIVTAAPPPYGFTARRAAGRLVLSGAYPDAAARAQLLALARDLFFEEELVDEGRLEKGAPDGYVAALALGLRHLALLASGEALVRDGALVVTGESLYRESAERMGRDLAKAVPRGWRTEARVEAAP